MESVVDMYFIHPACRFDSARLTFQPVYQKQADFADYLERRAPSTLSSSMKQPITAKIGGSLFDLPDLALRLSAWLNRFSKDRVLLVPGGGPLADLIRRFDRLHRLGNEASHWLALRAMSVNTLFLHRLIPGSKIASDPRDTAAEGVVVLDPYEFCTRDDTLPHCWNVTSDSVAARAAIIAGATRLYLCKSCPKPEPLTWQEAANLGLVDAYFPAAVRQATFAVEWVNLRETSPASGGGLLP
ncbi:MAG: hypothetical protein KatS3mg105_3599 [Gemmatales bacterium]|nr:MAG: hypothetical protein KatS3mg105_3599 [Gemmatales bacterium]